MILFIVLCLGWGSVILIHRYIIFIKSGKVLAIITSAIFFSVTTPLLSFRDFNYTYCRPSEVTPQLTDSLGLEILREYETSHFFSMCFILDNLYCYNTNIIDSLFFSFPIADLSILSSVFFISDVAIFISRSSL